MHAITPMARVVASCGLRSRDARGARLALGLEARGARRPGAAEDLDGLVDAVQGVVRDVVGGGLPGVLGWPTPKAR
jgi:hypothetical protein